MNILPEDIIFNILLFVDDNNLNSVCSTNLFVSACKNKHVWVQKLINNSWPNLLHDKLENTNWLIEYQKIVTAHNKTTELLALIEHEKLQDRCREVAADISINEIQNVLSDKILAEVNLLSQYDKSYIIMCLNDDNNIQFNYTVFTEMEYHGATIMDSYAEYNTIITLNNVYNILFNIYYYYQNKNIYDGYQWSYNKLDELHNIDIKNFKDQYMIDKYYNRIKLIKEGKL